MSDRIVTVPEVVKWVKIYHGLGTRDVVVTVLTGTDQLLVPIEVLEPSKVKVGLPLGWFTILVTDGATQFRTKLGVVGEALD